jgi:hypothetical protein
MHTWNGQMSSSSSTHANKPRRPVFDVSDAAIISVFFSLFAIAMFAMTIVLLDQQVELEHRVSDACREQYINATAKICGSNAFCFDVRSGARVDRHECFEANRGQWIEENTMEHMYAVSVTLMVLGGFLAFFSTVGTAGVLNWAWRKGKENKELEKQKHDERIREETIQLCIANAPSMVGGEEEDSTNNNNIL